MTWNRIHATTLFKFVNLFVSQRALIGSFVVHFFKNILAHVPVIWFHLNACYYIIAVSILFCRYCVRKAMKLRQFEGINEQFPSSSLPHKKCLSRTCLAYFCHLSYSVVYEFYWNDFKSVSHTTCWNRK